MSETIVGLFIAVLCVVGAVSIIKWIALRIAIPSDTDSRIYAVLLRDKNADIELQMAIETLEWDNTLLHATAYAVNCGLDSVTDGICETICKNSRFIYLTSQQFAEIITYNSD